MTVFRKYTLCALGESIVHAHKYLSPFDCVWGITPFFYSKLREQPVLFPVSLSG